MPHTLLVPISRPTRGMGGGEHRCRDGVANRGQSSTTTRPGSMAHVAALILDDVRTLDAQPLHVPMPRDKRLRTACAALLYGPGRPGTLVEWSDIAGASSRTLARLSASETGTRFVDWRHQARLPDALVRLARGQDVAPVSCGLGYASASAFAAMFSQGARQDPARLFHPRCRSPAS
jgi:AraC-like DNA-binding protein